MRLPHERYIRFLITSGLDLDDTNAHLLEKGLVPCLLDSDGGSEYWTRQYDLLHESKVPKAIKTFWSKDHKKTLPPEFLDYMNVVGLREAWTYNIGQNKNFAIAVDALEDEDVCLTSRVLLALRVPPPEVSALINGKFGMIFPASAVILFRDHFFDHRIMSRKSWKTYLELIPAEHKLLIYKALVGKGMEVRAELDLPNKISVSEHYQKLHIFAMEKFDTYRNSSNSEADQNAIKWAQIVMASGDKYEKLKLGDAADFSKELQMEFSYIDAEFPMIGSESLEEIRDSKLKGKETEKVADA